MNAPARVPLLLRDTVPASEVAYPIQGGTGTLIDFDWGDIDLSDALAVAGPNGSGWRVKYDYRPDADILLLEGRCPLGALRHMPIEIRFVRVAV